MTKLNETDVAILRAFYERKEQNPRYPRVSGKDLGLVELLHKSQEEIEFEIDYLTEEGYLKDLGLRPGFGTNLYELPREISHNGINYLREENQPAMVPPQVINIQGHANNCVFGNGNTTIYNLNEVLNQLRSHADSDEAKEIVSEIENETRSEHPSREKIQSLKTSLLSLVKDEVKQVVSNLIAFVIITCCGI